MMGLSQIKCCLVLVVCLSLCTALSAVAFVSDVISGQRVLSQRRLLQSKKPCPVNFEFQNYTIITSQCKGPNYSPKLCCSAFKDFACPFVDELNDLSNSCVTTMFSYININGKYPQGLFASLCREKKEGLECPPDPPSSPLSDEDNKSSGSRIICQVLSVAMLLAANLVLSLQLFV
ncbi:GPI-anchored protein LLG1 [Sesamum indicum]|uniref:GPI-anchored protein LLG1 n=1 Tax=Sesamum indicum TaxID=4182 RepID=A0A6I9USD4_SESIN|nr:GPI-anchored protein LLG1 [Sesamum indicum]